MQISYKKIKIESLETSNIEIPIIEIESKIKGPNVLIVANQHGKEISSFLVLEKFIKQIKYRTDLKGNIYIITTANPLGLQYGQRNEPISNKDLNRQYPGDETGDMASKIAFKIFNIAREMDLVIDLHNFTARDSKIIGILIKSDKKSFLKCQKILKIFNPDLIWQIDLLRKEDKRFEGSLDICLVEKDIPAIALEMPPIAKITEDQINKVNNGLFNILNKMDMLSNYAVVSDPIPIFNVDYIYSKSIGIFVPSVKIGSQVSINDIIGKVISKSNLNKKEVKSNVSGEVITISYEQFVKNGSKIASIGKKVGML